jgi:hypothetical protein
MSCECIGQRGVCDECLHRMATAGFVSYLPKQEPVVTLSVFAADNITVTLDCGMQLVMA